MGSRLVFFNIFVARPLWGHVFVFDRGTRCARTTFATTVEILFPAVLKTMFYLFLGPPPRGVPGEGPDCQFPWEVEGLGPIPARIWG